MFQVEHGGVLRQPEPGGGDQADVLAAATLHLDAVGRPEVFEFRGIERSHRITSQLEQNRNISPIYDQQISRLPCRIGGGESSNAWVIGSCARDPDDLTYGGYQIVDVQINGLVGGHGNAGRGYAMTLDDVQEWIEDETKTEADVREKAS